MNLDGRILDREDRKARLDYPKLGRPVLGLFLPTPIWEVSQVNSF